jgi:hypothetical protein
MDDYDHEFVALCYAPENRGQILVTRFEWRGPELVRLQDGIGTAEDIAGFLGLLHATHSNYFLPSEDGDPSSWTFVVPNGTTEKGLEAFVNAVFDAFMDASGTVH